MMEYSKKIKSKVVGVLRSTIRPLENGSDKGLGFDYRKIVVLVLCGFVCIQLLSVVPQVAAASYRLTIQSPSGSGSTSPGTGTKYYSRGINAKVTAYPSSGWKFDHWVRDGSNAGTSNPIYVSMYSSHTLKAVFTQTTSSTTYQLTIQSPSGSGSTSPGIGRYSYSQGTYIKVTAKPNSGWKFDHWVRDGSNAGTANPINVYMGSSHTLKAVFTQVTTTTQTTTQSTSSKPYVDGIVIRGTNGAPLRLHGWNVDIETTLSDLQWLKNKGYNAVRVVVYWDKLEPREGSYNWATLDALLANCKTLGLYAQIDFHQFHWSSYFTSNGAGIGFPRWLYDNSRGYGYYSPTNRQKAMDEFYLKNTVNGARVWQKYVTLWTAIITRYKSNPYVWAYEIMNEPMVGASHPDSVRSACMDRYRELIPKMRAVDPNTIIVCPSIDFGFNQKLNYPNIVWSRSLYPQYEGDLTTIVTKMKTMFNVGLGAPYIVSETGATSSYRSQASARLTDAFTKLKSIVNGGNNEVWYGWLYGRGTASGWQAPRNSDGSDSWLQKILANQLV